MGHGYALFGFLGVIWLFSLLAGALAIRGSRRKPARWFWLWLCLAVAAIGIGVLGFWTPLWPALTYIWTIGTFSVNIDFSWFFLAPLLLGAIAFVLVLRSHLKPKPVA